VSGRLDTKLRDLVEKRERRDETKDAAERAEKVYRQAEAAVWEEIKDEYGDLTSFTIDLPEIGKVKFGRRQTIRSRILDEEEFAAWAKETGRDDEFLKPGIHKRVLNEEVREAIDHGQPLPPGVDFSTTRFISIQRGKD
jgi:hypothetical protein